MVVGLLALLAEAVEATELKPHVCVTIQTIKRTEKVWNGYKVIHEDVYNRCNDDECSYYSVKPVLVSMTPIQERLL